jgi:hypothetical protein
MIRSASNELLTPQLKAIVQTLSEISSINDANELAQLYIARMQTLFPFDRVLSISRRGMQSPLYRLTRSNLWSPDANPWTEREKLPVFSRGLLGRLLYAGEVALLNDLNIDDIDPAYEHLAGMQSLVAVPHFDDGEALNMVIHASKDPGAFDPARLEEFVLLSSLFGQIIGNLITRRDLLKTQAWTKLQNESLQQLSDTVLDQAVELQRHAELLDSRVRERTAQLKEAHLESIEMLATACEAKDSDTGEHIRRIRQLTTDLALALGVAPDKAESMGYAAMLHDVGKLHIPDNIIGKPGKLTDAEREVMQTHSAAGERILSGKAYYGVARSIARSHHENYDGTDTLTA